MAQINISATTVKTAIDGLIQSGTITQEGYDSIWWYYNHCQANDWSQSRASREIKKSSWSTLYRVWTGTYGAGYESIIDSIDRVKIIVEQRAKLATIDFIETSVWHTISDVCDNALIGQEISTIHSDSQIGKSTAFGQYVKVNPGKRVILFRMPSVPNFSMFLNDFAAACYLARATNTNQMRQGILNSIDSRTLVIIDETHQLFLGAGKKSAPVAILEFLREVHDATGCGVVICGTNVLNDELTRGPRAKIFRQLMRRGIIHVQLPNSTPKDDIKLAASKFGIIDKPDKEAFKLIADIDSDYGFGILLKVMKAASTLAGKKSTTPTWDHFVEAWVILQKLSRKNKEEQ